MVMKDMLSIKEMAKEFLDTSPFNKIEELNIERIYDDPLVGLAEADDPLFTALKKEDVIGPNHLSPHEWLFEAETVISLFLPFSHSIRETNYSKGLPSKEWVYGRYEGEICNNELRKFLAASAQDTGVKSVTPILDPGFKVDNKKSNWSERHVAFIAGLGTFGLSKSLITSKGTAGRYCSIIIDTVLEPTERTYPVFGEFCSNCGACIARCPVGAIKKRGKDTGVCATYMDETIRPYFKPRHGCGKCQTDVPCEHNAPE